MNPIQRSKCTSRSAPRGAFHVGAQRETLARCAARRTICLRRIGFIRYGTSDPAALCELGVLSDEDRCVVEAANEFLLRLRNEMHFHAGKPGDVLDRAEQVRVADIQGYPPSTGMLPVEQFMRDIFAAPRG